MPIKPNLMIRGVTSLQFSYAQLSIASPSNTRSEQTQRSQPFRLHYELHYPLPSALLNVCCTQEFVTTSFRLDARDQRLAYRSSPGSLSHTLLTSNHLAQT